MAPVLIHDGEDFATLAIRNNQYSPWPACRTGNIAATSGRFDRPNPKTGYRLSSEGATGYP